MENSREVAINENIKLLTRERDSLRKENQEIKKEKQKLEDSNARDRESRKRQGLSAAIFALIIFCLLLFSLFTINENFKLRTQERDTIKVEMENLLNENKELEDTNVKLRVSLKRDLDVSAKERDNLKRNLDVSAKERDNLKSQIDKMGVELSQERWKASQAETKLEQSFVICILCFVITCAFLQLKRDQHAY